MVSGSEDRQLTRTVRNITVMHVQTCAYPATIKNCTSPLLILHLSVRHAETKSWRSHHANY